MLLSFFLREGYGGDDQRESCRSAAQVPSRHASPEEPDPIDFYFQKSIGSRPASNPK